MILRDLDLITVNRTINDLKQGLPVIIFNHSLKKKLIVLSVDMASLKTFNQLKNQCNEIFLLLTKERSNFLWKREFKKNQKLNCSQLSFEDIFKFSLSTDNNLKCNNIAENSNDFCDYGLSLTKLTELVPCLIISDDFSLDNGEKLLSVTTKQIDNYLNISNFNVIEVCSTPLKLKGTNAIIKSFRSTYDEKDHYALLIKGKNDQDISENDTPLVRIHSSCFTGDLLNSLACDCHDQLHTAIQKMSYGSGGIIVYLNQEGRGIGLTNKLRTYNAQKQGYDTVEANTILGFGDDHRTFPIASSILLDLGIKKINLLTNNPRKAKSLEENGIIIEKCVSHLVNVNPEAKKYIKTKAEKLDHKISI